MPLPFHSSTKCLCRTVLGDSLGRLTTHGHRQRGTTGPPVQGRRRVQATSGTSRGPTQRHHQRPYQWLTAARPEDTCCRSGPHRVLHTSDSPSGQPLSPIQSGQSVAVRHLAVRSSVAHLWRCSVLFHHGAALTRHQRTCSLHTPLGVLEPLRVQTEALHVTARFETGAEMQIQALS